MIFPEIQIESAQIHFRTDFKLPPAEFSVPAGRFALFFLASGIKSAKVTLPGGDIPFSADAPMKRGVILLLPPGAQWTCETIPEEVEGMHAVFSCPRLSRDWLRPHCNLMLDGGATATVGFVHRLTLKEIILLRPICELLHISLWARNSPALQLQTHIFFFFILSFLFKANAGERAKAMHERGLAEQLEKVIEDEGHSVKLAQIARSMDCSERWLRERCKAEFGVTPSAMKRAQTIDNARHLIENTSMPFKAITTRLGMSSPKYLYTFVKRNTGKTPSALRAKARAKRAAAKQRKVARICRK